MSISPLRIALVAGGGALLAAWLAAATTAPRGEAPVPAPPAPAPPAAGGAGPPSAAAADLAADLGRLRRQLADAPALRVGARNPFSLAPPPPPPGAARLDAAAERARRTVSGQPHAAGPALTLIGIASVDAEDGSRRTGILSVPNGEVLLVGSGDRVPGGYLVDAVEPSSVTLVDGYGARYRLDLP